MNWNEPAKMAETTDVRIRAGVPDDAELIARFLCDLAAHGGLPGRSRITADDVLQFGFGERSCFETLLAERTGVAAGLVLFYPTFSTWEARPGLFVNDLYVGDRHRGCGVGRRLLSEVAKLALARGCSRVEWQVLAGAEAKGFYEALGAARIDEFLIYRIADGSLARLAGHADRAPPGGASA